MFRGIIIKVFFEGIQSKEPTTSTFELLKQDLGEKKDQNEEDDDEISIWTGQPPDQVPDVLVNS